ncbi:MAG: MarR family transcriptional regulator [Subtercola sp.]|nr:MarR family transcriptional regulator [Subtercola sp.]
MAEPTDELVAVDATPSGDVAETGPQPPEPRWLNCDERVLWMRLQAVAEYIPAAVDAQLRASAGLTRYDYYVLAMLSESPGRARLMSDLAAVTNGSLSRLSHAAAKLEEGGLISRSPVEADRRATLATLTDAGWQKLVDTAPGHVAEVRAIVFDNLTSDQVSALNAALVPVIQGLGLPCETFEIEGDELVS